MKLAFRFWLAAIIPVSLIILGNGYLRVKREIRLLTEEVAIHQRAMGRAISAGVVQAWPQGGDEGARRLVETAGASESLVSLRWRSTSDAFRPQEKAALLRGEVWVEGKPGGDERLRSLVPVLVEGKLVGAIEMVERLDREDAYLDATWVRVGANTVIAVVAVSLLMGLLGWLFVARRIDRLVRVVRRIGMDGEAEAELAASFGNDELGALAAEIISMQGRLVEARARLNDETEHRLRTLEQLRHADRLSTVGKLASGMAHELGTPLNVALGRARMLQEGAPPEKQAQYVDVIIKQIERISSIIRLVLDFSRRQTPAVKVSNLMEVAEQTVHMLAPAAKKKGVSLSAQGEPIRAAVDAAQIDQVVANLVVNAIHACESGASIEVSVGQAAHDCTDGQHRECAFIRVRDDGPGMPSEVMEQVFDPFFTTKDVGEGTGLGLAVAYGIATDHGGEIEVSSVEGEGSRFTVWLPRRDDTEGT